MTGKLVNIGFQESSHQLCYHYFRIYRTNVAEISEMPVEELHQHAKSVNDVTDYVRDYVKASGRCACNISSREHG